jgi:uncharacterized membrane protein YqiK
MLELLITSAIVILVALVTIGLIFAKLYRRSTKEVSFVRTGLGGQRVIMNGGALVLPVVHEAIPVNMNTNRLEVARAKDQALITKDRMRVDVAAEFYVRVSPNENAIATAAQTLGKRTMHIDQILELIEGKFVDALRSVAAKMAMEELHEQRVNFVQEVQVAVSEDLQQNGLELETVSLTGLDQTDKKYFNPQNVFDAEGLTKLTQSIEERQKRRNDIEQDTQVAMQTKNLEAERQKLELSRETEYANLNQQREIEIENYRAEQAAEIAKQKANQERAASEAKIAADQQVEQAEIEKKQAIAEKDIAQRRAVESAEIERKKAIELAEQERAIAIANKSREESEAKASADLARAEAVKAEETVSTARDVAQADSQKQIELIEAHKQAERDAIGVTVTAATEKKAAEDKAEAARLRAQGEADAQKITAQADAEAIKIRAEADEQRYKVEAEGQRQLNEAANTLSETQIEMQVKLKAIEQLPAIIEQTVKPMERIEGIKIYQIEGLNPGAGAGHGDAPNNRDNLADQVTNAALRYRMHAPLLDNILKEIGLNTEQGLDGMTAGMSSKMMPVADQGETSAPDA